VCPTEGSFLYPFLSWYIGGLNAWGERTIQVDCSFLPQDKKYTIEIFQDKKRSNKNANLYEHKIMDTDNKNIIEMFMASGGGFVMVIREK
jgi:alpha-glucosidase